MLPLGAATRAARPDGLRVERPKRSHQLHDTFVVGREAIRVQNGVFVANEPIAIRRAVREYAHQCEVARTRRSPMM
jgi:hypothetical protein